MVDAIPHSPEVLQFKELTSCQIFTFDVWFVFLPIGFIETTTPKEPLWLFQAPQVKKCEVKLRGGVAHPLGTLNFLCSSF